MGWIERGRLVRVVNSSWIALDDKVGSQRGPSTVAVYTYCTAHLIIIVIIHLLYRSNENCIYILYIVIWERQHGSTGTKGNGTE